MRNQNSKVRTTKRKLQKCEGVCRTFCALQYWILLDILNFPSAFETYLADGFYETKYLILKCYLFEQFIKFVFGYLQMRQTEVY